MIYNITFKEMIIIFISDYLGVETKGHQNYEFVDAFLNGDNQLFIDPCMIEGAEDPWSKNAANIMRGFFDCLFEGLREKTLYTSGLLSHAGEQNATKLGYGNGYNGKGKTAEGLWDCISGLSLLVHDIPTISRAQDIPVLVEGFAEDCMSDLLTNILHEPLNIFTCEQMSAWGCAAQGEKAIWTFDIATKEWIQVVRPCWYYKGKELLLVPKWIVRKNFLFKAHQYLYSVIVERIRKANGWDDLKKVDIWSNLPRISEHWEYDTVIAYTREHPEALSEYHDHMPRFYRRARGCMTDTDLDIVVYGRRTQESA